MNTYICTVTRIGALQCDITDRERRIKAVECFFFDQVGQKQGSDEAHTLTIANLQITEP